MVSKSLDNDIHSNIVKRLNALNEIIKDEFKILFQ